MWTVKSESGRLHAVLVQESIEYFWEKKLPFVGIESNSHYLARCPHALIEGGREQWSQLIQFLDEEGVHVFEVISILKKTLDGATLGEKKKIIDSVWKGMPIFPTPQELTVEHLIEGYPSSAFYDENSDRVVLPDFQRVGWPYPRDTSFTTPIGTVICNMRRYSRHFEPRVVKLCYEYDPVLRKETQVIWDAHDTEKRLTEPSCIEGGDTHIIDEETIAIGLGQRSTYTGFMETAKKLFENDPNKLLKHILAVRLPAFPASDYMHLDVVINYPAPDKVLIMPYFFESEIVKDIPPRRLLQKLLEAARAQSEADNRSMSSLVHPLNFEDAGSCHVYSNSKNGLKLVRREISFIDYLIKEEKLEPDGIIYVGGKPEKDNDVEHLMLALMEQARGASNIVTIKPELVIAYERNAATNEALREFGIRIKKWEDSYLDLLGGPHCSTSPLWRDSP